jgi:predicted ATPase
MIEQQFTRLSTDEQQVLEAASVVGVEFSTAATAAGLAMEVEAVEERCEALAGRGQFLHPGGVEEWPDGTAAGRYRFRHALQQQVVYERLPVGRRARLHRQVGARVETAYGERTGERAAELARHFEQGRDFWKAVRYRRQAAENALGRWAYHEAIGHLTTGVEILKRLPETRERAQRELDCQTALGLALMVTKGFATPEVGAAYARAAELCQQIGEASQLFPLLWQLRGHHMVRGETQTAYELAEQLLSLAEDDRPYWLALLAEMYGKNGPIDDGLQALTEASAVVHTQGLHVWQAELFRLRGELFLQQAGEMGLAEACFRQALEITRHQSAKSLELRAALSLSRLWQRQDRRLEAYELLAGIYDWFTQGFDTSELREARVLLGEVGSVC